MRFKVGVVQIKYFWWIETRQLWTPMIKLLTCLSAFILSKIYYYHSVTYAWNFFKER